MTYNPHIQKHFTNLEDPEGSWLVLVLRDAENCRIVQFEIQH